MDKQISKVIRSLEFDDLYSLIAIRSLDLQNSFSRGNKLQSSRVIELCTSKLRERKQRKQSERTSCLNKGNEL